MQDNFISIIIPTLNRPDDLAKTLECLLVQDFKSFQLILVDQSDDDKSNYIANIYISKGLPLIYYHSAIKSGAQARNFAIDKIDYLDNLYISKNRKTNSVVFLDDDVSFDKDFLTNLNIYIFTNPEVAGGTWKIKSPAREVGFAKKIGIFLLGGGRGINQQIVTKFGFNQMFDKQPEVESNVQWTSGCGMRYRKSVLDVGHRFPKHFLKYSIMEDLFLSYRIFLENSAVSCGAGKYSLTYTPSVEMTHHESPNRSIPNYQKIRQHCIHRYIFHKTFGISMIGYIWTIILLMKLDLLTFRKISIIGEYYKSLIYIYQNRKNLTLDNGDYNEFIFDL